MGCVATCRAEWKCVIAAVGDPQDRRGHARRGPLLADAVTALFTALLLISTVTVVGAVAPIAWDALPRALVAEMATDPLQCTLINNGRDRLACYDDYVKEMMRPPAKGAFAPPEAFGERTPGSDRVSQFTIKARIAIDQNSFDETWIF
jgi:hypothetical protein